MKSFSNFILLFLLASSCLAQPNLKDVLKELNTESVPYITVDSLLTLKNAVLLDAREPKEFNVSHIKNAVFVGYTNFKPKKVLQQIPNKNTPIVIYCSIGVRSEDIAERLLKKGYTNVTNLYGGIFEWKKKNQPVYDKDNKATNKVHAFDKFWGKLLTNAEKVY